MVSEKKDENSLSFSHRAKYKVWRLFAFLLIFYDMVLRE